METERGSTTAAEIDAFEMKRPNFEDASYPKDSPKTHRLLMNRLQATIGDHPSDRNKTNGAVSSGHSARPDDKQQEVSIESFLSEVRHILVPVNLAQDSLKTIRCAIRLGQHCGSRLTLLHVYQLPVAFGIPSGTDRNTELLEDRHEAAETLKAQGPLG